jgi:phospholipid/cholesterol/gamma-HCH transport system substrate-binding protein/paraquat-inducible protein B
VSTRANYFKLGIFIISAVAFLILALIFMGLGALHQDKVMIETYFNESVQGLDVGSPLRFKGVKVGSIERIRFVFNKYHDFAASPYRYVLVEMSLDPDSAMLMHAKGNVSAEIAAEVENGLRVRIAPQGLTGTAYLEMDYVDPARNVPLPIAWTPEYYYVPSSPSTIARLEETFELFSKTLRKVEEAGVDQAVMNMNELLQTTKKAVEDTHMAALSQNVDSLITELRHTNDNLNSAISSKESKEAIKNLTETLSNMKASTENLPATIDNLRRLLREANSMLSSQRDEVQGILQQGKQVFENLNDLTGEAKRNPSRLIFGGPPAKTNPEKK